MFGSKTKEIARLVDVVDEYESIRDDMSGQIDRLREQLVAEQADAKRRANINADLTHEVSGLKAELGLAAQEKQGWIADYQQLNDRYSLLDSVLKQLHVNVTLPAKKSRA